MTQEVGGWKEKTPPAVRWPENAHLGTIAVSELEDPERKKPPQWEEPQGGGGSTGRGRSYREVPKGEALRRRSP